MLVHFDMRDSPEAYPDLPPATALDLAILPRPISPKQLWTVAGCWKLCTFDRCQDGEINTDREAGW